MSNLAQWGSVAEPNESLPDTSYRPEEPTPKYSYEALVLKILRFLCSLCHLFTSSGTLATLCMHFCTKKAYI